MAASPPTHPDASLASVNIDDTDRHDCMSLIGKSLLESSCILRNEFQNKEYNEYDRQCVSKKGIIVTSCGYSQYNSRNNRWVVYHREMKNVSFADSIETEKKDNKMVHSFFTSSMKNIPQVESTDEWKIVSAIKQIPFPFNCDKVVAYIYPKNMENESSGSNRDSLKILIRSILSRIELTTLFFQSSKNSHFLTCRSGKLINIFPLYYYGNTSVPPQSNPNLLAKYCSNVLEDAGKLMILSIGDFPLSDSNTAGRVHPWRRISAKLVGEFLRNFVIMEQNEAEKPNPDNPVNLQVPPFTSYANQNYPQLKIIHPQLKSTEIVQKLGELWKMLTKKQQAKFKPPPTPNKTKKMSMEIKMLQTSYVPHQRNNKDIKQLFAADFNVTSSVPPKRQIKAVIRYQPKYESARDEKSRQQNKIHVSDGFQCPQCENWCFYDETVCSECQLNCRYVAGVGVVVVRDRDMISRDIVFDNPRVDNDKKRKVTTDEIITPANEKKKKIVKKKPNESISDSISISQSPSSAKILKIDGPKQSNSRNGENLSSTLIKNETSSVISPIIASPNKIRKKYGQHLPRECEVCFEVRNRIENHRFNVHCLHQYVYGCPHCFTVCQTLDGRLSHMKRKHPGFPTCMDEMKLNSKTLMPTKRALPLIHKCPMCYSGFETTKSFQKHIRSSHHTCLDISAKYLCPFCPLRNKLQFKTLTSVAAHIKNEHKGCSIQSEQDSLTKNTTLSPNTVVTTPVKKVGSNTDSQSPVRVKQSPVRVKQSPVRVKRKKIQKPPPIKHWEPLKVLPKFVQNLKLIDCEISTQIILARIHEEMDTLSKSLTDSESAMHENPDESEHVADLRSYKRSIRARTAKSESERGEREKFKEDSLEQKRVWDYENRNRKKTTHEIEYDNLCRRVLVSDDSQDGVDLVVDMCENDCLFCNGTYAQDILGVDKKEGALGMQKDTVIQNPVFREISNLDAYLPEEGTYDGGKRIARRTAVIRSQKINDLGELEHLKHTVNFIVKYNEGLLITEKDTSNGKKRMK